MRFPNNAEPSPEYYEILRAARACRKKDIVDATYMLEVLAELSARVLARDYLAPLFLVRR